MAQLQINNECWVCGNAIVNRVATHNGLCIECSALVDVDRGRSDNGRNAEYDE